MLLRLNVGLHGFRCSLNGNIGTGDRDSDASVHNVGSRLFDNRLCAGLFCYALRYGLCRLLNG